MMLPSSAIEIFAKPLWLLRQRKTIR